MKESWPWVTLVLLGAYHGLNPGMGWLFAVALGLQERSRAAVIRAFAPIALGHAASIAVVVAAVAALQSMISLPLLKWAGAGMLVAFGLYKLIVPMSCPRWVGMRVGFRDLTVWSFLMATACGAGLMVVPVLLKLPANANGPIQAAPASLVKPAAAYAAGFPPSAAGSMSGESKAKTAIAAHSAESSMPACHTQVAAMATHGPSGPLTAAGAVIIHTLAMFMVMAGIALVVFEKIGLAILRRAWINLDLLWAGALIAAGVLTLAL